MGQRTPAPLCIKCKRVMRKTDQTVVEGEHKVHAPGFCRGPYVKRWFIVGLRKGKPSYVGRLPFEEEELESVLNEVSEDMEIQLRKMDSRRLAALIEEMQR